MAVLLQVNQINGGLSFVEGEQHAEVLYNTETLI